MSQCTELLNQIVRRNGLNAPDGRMLCKYRCTSEEFNRLRDILQAVGPHPGTLPQDDLFVGALFCLFAAEWWRQNYKGGRWSYNGILEAIGKNPDLYRQELYRPIRSGLRYWKRRLLTVGDSNAYLVTLSCEAGLPLKLLHSENDSKFRRYLRSLLREFQVYGGHYVSATDLAGRMAYILPRGLRQAPLYQICGELIEKIWEFQIQIGDVDNPLQALEQKVPEWRQSLPLVVSDDAAEALLSNLVNEAATLKRIQEIKVATVLTLSSGRYQLKRAIQLPSYFDQNSLSELLQVTPSELPYRLQIIDRSNDDASLVCLITRRTMEGDGKYAIEVVTKTSTLQEGLAAAREVQLQARFGESVVDLNRIKGSMPLSALPWIFAPQKDESDAWSLIGEGSLKTRHNVVLVAVEGPARPYATEGQCVSVGALEEFGRQLFQLTGCAVIDSEDGQFQITTSASEEESSHFLVYGSVLASGLNQTKIYRGFPKVQRCFEGGGAVQIQPEQLQWRPRGLNGPWFPVSKDCVGPVQIRYALGGNILFRADIDVVPPASTIRYKPDQNNRSGAIELTGFALEDCGIHCPPEVESRRVPIEDGFRFELKCSSQAPGSLPLHLRWQERREIRVEIPYPARGVRFIGRDGRVLGPDEKIHVSQMGGVLVQVMEPERPDVRYLIEATVISGKIDYQNYQLKSEGPYLVEVAPGRHEFDLRALEDKCRLLFSGTEDLDAWIRVGILSSMGDQFPQKIYVARYDLTLNPDKNTGEVFIPEEDRNIGTTVIKELEVKTFPLGSPKGNEMEILPSVSDGVWQFSPETREPGPWLVTGWSWGWCRTRPLCWTVGRAGNNDLSNGAKSLEDCISISDASERANQICLALERLKADPGDPDWRKVYGYFNMTRDLPAPTFDLLVEAAKRTDVAASCLINATEEVFDDVWTGLQRLPFFWPLVPVEDWLQAAKIRHDYLKSNLLEAAEVLQVPVDSLVAEEFKKFFNQCLIRFPGFKPIEELISNSILSVPLGKTQLATMANGAGRSAVAAACILGPSQELMQVHADDYWPQAPEMIDLWWNKYADQVPEDLHGIWRIFPDPGFRASVLLAPIAAAFSSAFNLHINKYFRFNIRRLRDFDQNWFDSVYGCALAACIGCRLERGMSYGDA